MPGALGWDEFLGEPGELTFERVPFDAPLWIVYSSGTTGRPKPIVHGHGGIVLEHLKQQVLHNDLGPGDTFFWFTTTGWMMWNYLLSGLLAGATIVAYDGSPGHPDLGALWRMAEAEGVTAFGVGAPFISQCLSAGIVPRELADLSRLRLIGSTGAPLPPAAFGWVYENVSSDVLLASISGGTDVCTAFAGGTPLAPVYAGEIQTRMLGCAMAAYDENGEEVVGEVGELVVTAPMPSMPVGFWRDPSGQAYREAYFTTYPGVWRHGDWCRIVPERGSVVVSGRSDATLNRGGVRLGTAEFYGVVNEIPEVLDSLVVDTSDQLLLFVVLADGAGRWLDDDLRRRINAALRTQLSPRHVPDRIEARPRPAPHAQRQEARGAGEADPARRAAGPSRRPRRRRKPRCARGFRAFRPRPRLAAQPSRGSPMTARPTVAVTRSISARWASAAASGLRHSTSEPPPARAGQSGSSRSVSTRSASGTTSTSVLG